MMSLVASYAVEGLLQDHASTVQLLLPALSATVPQHIRWILLTLMLGAGTVSYTHLIGTAAQRMRENLNPQLALEHVLLHMPQH